jgi:hypothetical protein
VERERVDLRGACGCQIDANPAPFLPEPRSPPAPIQGYLALKKTPLPVPYDRAMPWAIWWSLGEGVFL